MTMDHEWIALARYVAGECSPDERETMRRWIAEDADRARLALEMELIGRASALDRSAWNTPGAWERLLVRAQRGATAPTPRARRALTLLAPQSRSRGWIAGWALAAAVVLAAGALAWTQLRVRAARTSLASATSAERVFSTRRAQAAEVRLGDGTVVSLAPESRLVVPAGYGAIGRTVTLEGEGYFRVTHDSLRPFIVRAGRGVVHDLGTAFVVTSYPGDTVVRVVVAEGRVRVRAAESPAGSGPVLGRGDLARLGSADAPVVRHDVDVAQYLGWTEGRLVFYRAPLPDALEQLGRWYDVRFVLKDTALRARRVTMALPTTSADALVEALSLALDLRAERQGDTITLRANAHTPTGGQQP